MKIYIDADGCPVKNIAVNICKKNKIEAIIVADTAHYFKDDYAKVITVPQGSDSADYAIVNMIQENDIVITQDYGLAALVLAKKGRAINQSGLIYTNVNIDYLLASRYLNEQARRQGGRVKGPKKRKNADNAKFIEAFNTMLEA